MALDARALREAFGADGFVYLRGAVCVETLAALNAQLAHEIASPSIAPESGETRAPDGAPLDLAEPCTWPSAQSRRVVEVTPPGDTVAWASAVASPPLVAALDALLGADCWELPANGPAPPGGGRVHVRHWYAPVVFPEVDPSVGSWTPINRRCQRWRGWHVDIGPGFETDELRTSAGHAFQGCVVLLLGSDWALGGGGTALIRGSHRWVHAALSAAGAAGVTHQQLNTWASREAAARRLAGALRLPYEARPEGEVAEVHQACGAAGDVVLMHPWLIHSGTSNCSAVPRVLYNGMVRVKAQSFAATGCATLRLLGADAVAAAGEGGARDAELLEPPPKRHQRASAESLAAEVRALAARAEAAGPRRSLPSCAAWPLVSVIVPVHNGASTLDAALESVLCQSYPGRIEVSLFDDASSDGSAALVRAWAERLRAAGLDAVVSGSRWPPAGEATARAGGIGFANNACVRQSAGSALVFLDADDVMLPRRIEEQVAALRAHPRALVGGAWRRLPDGATAHYEAWANGLPPERLWLEQFRETTVQMPTWCVSRAAYERVGGFAQAPCEDLSFFLKHLDGFARLLRPAEPAEAAPAAGGTAEADASARVAIGARLLRTGCDVFARALRAAIAADPPIVRVGSGDAPTLLYRWSARSMTSTVSRRELLAVRVAAFERRVLSQPHWASFTVWGAGRDGKQFVCALSAAARARVVALADIDPSKVGTTYTNQRLVPHLALPIVHTRELRPPAVVCVGLRRADERGGVEGDPAAAGGAGSAQPTGEIERAAQALGLVEGLTLWYFF